MPASTSSVDLSRRERQIMDIVYRCGQVTVRDVMKELPAAPSYSAVRALMGILERKGQLRHRQEGQSYVYFSMIPQQKARHSALRKLLATFFNNSVDQAVVALLELKTDLDSKEIERLTRLTEEALRKGEK